MNQNNDKLSIEMQQLFVYIMGVLTVEYPTKQITPEYIIVAILDSKKTNAYSLLNSCLLSSNITELRNIYCDFLQKNATQYFFTNEEKNLPFDKKMQNVILKTQDEKDKLKSDEMGSEHFLLSILNPNNGCEDIINVFQNMGVNYQFLFDKCLNKAYKQNKENKSLKNNIVQIKNNMQQPFMNQTNKGSYIEQFTINLNSLAKKGEFDELIGRDKEINQIIKVLARRKKNNVILVGKSGVGKTQILYGIADLINHNNVPEILHGKELVMVNVPALVSGTHFRGMFEERVNGLFEELKKSKKHILIFDDMQSVLKNSSKEKDTDISSMIGNILTDGAVRIIGTTNFKDYRNAIEANASISRKLQKIVIEPTSIEESITILENNKTLYEEHHKVKYSKEIIELCVKLSDRYITERSLPDSAFDVLDLSGAKTCLERKENDLILNFSKEIEQLENEKNDAVESNNIDRIPIIDEKINKCKIEIAKIKRETYNINNYIDITEDHVLSTISEITSVPVEKLQIGDKEEIANIDKVLKEEIIGQDEAIDAVCRVIKRNKVGLGNKTKTRANILLAGKTGVGKTLLAKKIAEKIYGSENALVRIDMSEYAEKTSISKLTGAAPSYIGYENGGQLTEAIKHNPYCVLLLDEIEKAHKDVFNVFLQLFDEGRLTDNSGQVVNFKNVMVLLTSNVGSKQVSEMGKGIGFIGDQNANEKNVLAKSLKQTFTPEFLNRLDNVVYFNALTDDNIKDIIKLELNKFINRLNEIKFNLKYEQNVIEFLHELAIKEKEYGARPIIRIVQNYVEDEITDLMLKNEYEINYTFNAKIKNNKLIFE